MPTAACWETSRAPRARRLPPASPRRVALGFARGSKIPWHESTFTSRTPRFRRRWHQAFPFRSWFTKCSSSWARIPRVVEVFARRLQVQERLTDQVAEALCRVLTPLGVGVVIEAYHLCMMMRGVEKQNSKTVTSALRGAFRDDAKTRDEFLRLVHGGAGLP